MLKWGTPPPCSWPQTGYDHWSWGGSSTCSDGAENVMNSHFLFSFHKCRCWIKVPSASNWGPLPVHFVQALVPVTSKPGSDAWWLQSVLQKASMFIADVSNLWLCLVLQSLWRPLEWIDFVWRGIFFNGRHLDTLHIGGRGRWNDVIHIVYCIWQYGYLFETFLIDDMYIVEYIASLKTEASSWMEGTCQFFSFICSLINNWNVYVRK